MKLSGSPDPGFLTYCTNIHAGESWEDIFDGIKRHVPDIKSKTSPNAPMGIGLRLSAMAAESLRDEKTFVTFQDYLLEQDCFIFTLNAFPYGNFHGQPVKEGAYRPDWSHKERLDYTNLMADHLVKWLPDGIEGSISTVPGSYKSWTTGPDSAEVVVAIVDNIICHVAHLVEIQQQTGKVINLALEPEPCCMIETIEETIGFFKNSLFNDHTVDRLAHLIGFSKEHARDALRLHLGVCYDVCHAAVEFEDAADSLAKLKEAGIKISKLQLSSAMRIAKVDASTQSLLGAMNEPTYMHQVIENRSGAITRFTDIPFALDTVDDAQGTEWRIHFHVPIFLEEMQSLGTTQAFLKDVLAIHAADPVTRQLEVETYTWDVLPEKYRVGGLSEAIARELNWVKEQLAS